MDDRRKTLLALVFIVGFLLLIVLIIGIIVSGRKLVSPIPEDDAIKILFITPTSSSQRTSTSSAISR